MPARIERIGRKTHRAGGSKSPIRTTTLKFTAKDFVAQHTKSADGKSLAEDYDIDFDKDVIEEGTKSIVYRCTHKATGEERAVKIVEKSSWNDDANDSIKHEIDLLKKMDHPNIVRIFSTFEDEKHYYIVMDYCKGGELRDQLYSGTGLSEYYIAVLMKTLLSTINYVYEKHQVVHLGIKAENILLEGHRHVEQLKLIDFGNSIQAPKAQKLDRLVGAAAYLAPESLQHQNYGHKTDCWAIGVLAFLGLSGSTPFAADSDMETLELILNSKEEVLNKDIFKGEAWEGISSDAIDFVSKMLSFEPFKRPSAKEALQHPWIKRVTEAQVEVIEKYDTPLAQSSMENMFKLQATSKLQQAALTYIASQCLTWFDKQSMERIFQGVDVRASGKLTKEDVKIAYQKYMVDTGKSQHALTGTEVDELFQRVSFAGNNTVEYSEFLVAALPKEVLLTDENIQKAFATFDKDADGKISEDDLKKVLSFYMNTEEGSLDLYIRDKVLKQMPVGEDGKIGFDSFAEMLRNSKSGPGRDPDAALAQEQQDDADNAAVPFSGNIFDQYRLVFERNLKA